MWDVNNIELLKNLWTAGHSAGQIAGQIGCSRSAVCAKLQRLGLKRGRKPPTAKPRIASTPRRTVRSGGSSSDKYVIDHMFDETEARLQKVVSVRKAKGQQSEKFTKAQLQAMLAAAVRNTG
jgi:GcrA cell cycle regulator